MMSDLTTSIHAAVTRAASRIDDRIAQEGLSALKQTLDAAGFPMHDGLKSYEIRSTITDGGISFEIILDSDSVVAGDAAVKKLMEEKVSEATKRVEKVFKTYVMTDNGPQRRDIRKTAMDRLVERGMVIRSPRSIEMTSDGQVKVAMDRLEREGTFNMTLPSRQLQGILGEYEKRLRAVISEKFVPELQTIIRERLP